MSYLKDLVTLVDPTNPYSYLNYLHSKGCLYQFITANFEAVSRSEFADYLQWVFNSLNNVDKGSEVTDLDYNGEHLKVTTSTGDILLTKNLVLGTGLRPYIPKCCRSIISDTVFHNSEFMFKKRNFKNKTLAIIGGGQSAAEIVQSLISDEENMPAKILWFSKRLNFLPIDDSPFTNELFVPAYSRHFFSLSSAKKERLLAQHKLASDGISESTAVSIYRRLYELKYVKKLPQICYLLPSHELHDVNQLDDRYSISVSDLEAGLDKQYNVDGIILCTGYHYHELHFLKKISNQLNRDKHGLIVDEDYRLHWEGDKNCAIYIQNGARHTHGVADPNLSLLAYRSARIINQISGKEVYQNVEGDCLIQWGLVQ